ncbi:helix-turn-helix domain-containing protein [Arsenicicoccus dermatophilus]|uniref:helix-turn-helix domain-containing protein n=1 Tax=Arsenicicoccus dermatophilus TaxID=1076331 RepID=UPI001F4CF5EE|nr:helix-turn-helix transcriptional regulator [Arsenicicoccus dermatophilus]MCH8613428.1 helix-turn-helix domain-containing protein [Arsenicicoccus dermatophilus]
MQLRDHRMLREAITARGLTQRGIARAVGHASPSHINALATGKKTSTSPQTALLIERWLGVPAGSLFEPRTSLDEQRKVHCTETAA